LTNPTDQPYPPGKSRSPPRVISLREPPLARHLIDMETSASTPHARAAREMAPNAETLVALASLEIDNPKRQASALDHVKRALERRLSSPRGG